MRPSSIAVLILSLACCAFGQTYTIDTFAGGGLPTNIPGTSAGLRAPRSPAVDAAGNVFFLDENVLLRLNGATGVLTVVAGTGVFGTSGDNGPATSAQLGWPYNVAVDTAGNLYLAEQGNARIRKVSNGVITTVAGIGVFGFSGDGGPATNARVNNPYGVAVDSAGNLYFSDLGNRRIRKISTNGVITTVAGNGTAGYSGDGGPATSAQVSDVYGVAVDSAGALYLADTSNQRIRKVSNGIIDTVAGTGLQSYGGDGGPATGAQLNYPTGVAVDAAGNLYIADSGNYRIRRVTRGVIDTVAGTGYCCYNSGDNGPATSAQFDVRGPIAVDATGSLYVADTYYNRIRKIINGGIATVAGGGSLGDNGPAQSAELSGPEAVAVDSAGNLYISDANNLRIRKVSKGVVTTVAGTGTRGHSGDNGPATNAQLAPSGIAVDSAGALYIGDGGRICKVSNGTISTVAGTFTSGYSGDNGPAIGAQLSGPRSIVVDAAGDLYFADMGNQRIRKVSHGVITTVAGNGTAGYSGDGGPATGAQLNFPTGVAVDSAGNLYIADSFNYRIRKVSNGVITTVAGTGTPGDSGDNGPATSARMSWPWGIALDAAGNLYIADRSSNRVRKVSNGVITTVAGNGTYGFSGDGGPATSGQLFYPEGIAMDGIGNLYIADEYNDRIRVLTPSPSIAAVANAASNLADAISPGEIVVLYGVGIGPAQLVTAAPGSDGSYGAQVANASVSFNGIPAPMIYAGALQTAAIVPYGISGTNAQVTVTYQGQISTVFSALVASSAPGIFTLDRTGQGLAAAINQDGVTVNSATNPTKIGDVISLYATGEGQTTPAGVDGEPASVPYPCPNLPVTATVGGQNATVKYAGGAPGQVAGLMQVNVQIPAGIQTGNAVQVVLRIGNVFSQGSVTIAVR